MRQRIRWQYPLLALLSACLTGCGEAPSGYFPLQPGLVWHYQVVTEDAKGKREDTLAITNYGKVSDDSEYYVRGTSSGNYYYITKRDDSIMRVARSSIIEPELKLDDPARFIIKEPLQAGTKWEHRMRPYLLTSQTAPTIKEAVRYLADWEIVATDATIEVPQGRFENCLHVQGYAEVAVPRSRLLHLMPHIMHFQIDEWYAPGVGLVKLEYAETTDSEELMGGTINIDLIALDF